MVASGGDEFHHEAGLPGGEAVGAACDGSGDVQYEVVVHAGEAAQFGDVGDCVEVGLGEGHAAGAEFGESECVPDAAGCDEG